MKAFRITLSMAAFTGLLAAHAFAQDNASGRSPEDINQEIIENATTAPDGTVQPETGRANPVENWFGCKPDNDKPECKADNSQEKSGAASSEDETASKRVQ